MRDFYFKGKLCRYAASTALPTLLAIKTHKVHVKTTRQSKSYSYRQAPRSGISKFTVRQSADENDTPASVPHVGGSSAWPAVPILSATSVQSRWNAVHLAFLGDSVWELSVRNHFFSPPTRLTRYYANVQSKVRAEAQAAFYDLLMSNQLLSQQELEVLRWGSNANVAHRAPKRLSASDSKRVGTYKKATALECLIGFLYLTDIARLDQLVQHLLSASRPNSE